MVETLPKTDQIRFVSSKTGSHSLDTYLESVEQGTATLADMITLLFDNTGAIRTDLFQFRIKDEGGGDYTLQSRIGDFVDPEEAWVDISEDVFDTILDLADAAVASATASASTATTQASTATTKASEAAASAAAALASELAAVAAASGFRFKSPARAATTSALPACTYSNGTAGVGATLTGNSNGALSAQDGITLLVNETLLVKDQAAPLQNGLYTLTQVGTGGTPFILTRKTDLDTWTEVNGATVSIDEGSTLADSVWLCTSNTGGTMGTTDITWSRFPTFLADGSVGLAKLEAGVQTSIANADTALRPANGQIMQVLSTTKTDTFSHSTSSFTDVTGLSQAITPADNTNKVLVVASISVGVNTGVDNACFIKLLRDSTDLGNGASDGANRVECMASAVTLNTNAIQTITVHYLDSPATSSAVTYKIQIAASNSGDVYVNRSHSDSDATSIPRCSSTITVMEVRA